MVCVVRSAYGEAVVVVVVTVGVVAAGAAHGLLCSLIHQLTGTPLLTMFTCELAVRTRLRST